MCSLGRNVKPNLFSDNQKIIKFCYKNSWRNPAGNNSTISFIQETNTFLWFSLWKKLYDVLFWNSILLCKILTQY